MAARLLVVDDDETMRTLIRLYAERDNDFEVVAEAGACDDAVAIQKEVKAEIVTMDFQMPGADGAECIKRLREVSPGVPVLALTSSGKDVMQKMLDAGAYGTLDKAYVRVVASALKEGLSLYKVGADPTETSGIDKLRDALARLEKEAAEELAARKSVVEKRIDLVIALDAICVALDNPKYSEADRIQHVRRLTARALAADQSGPA